VNAMISGHSFDLERFTKTWRGVFLSLFGFNVIIYGGVVVAWYALTYYSRSAASGGWSQPS